MTQMSFSDAEYAGKRKQTRREIFQAGMEQVMPWTALLALIEPVYPQAGKGRRPYPVKTMLQNWIGYSDQAMEEALYEVAPLRRFTGLSLTRGSVPDETAILNFRHLLEAHDLAPKVLAAINTYLTDEGLLLRHGTIVDATIIHAPSSTMNEAKARDPEMHQTRKGQQRTGLPCLQASRQGDNLACVTERETPARRLARNFSRAVCWRGRSHHGIGR